MFQANRHGVRKLCLDSALLHVRLGFQSGCFTQRPERMTMDVADMADEQRIMYLVCLKNWFNDTKDAVKKKR